ncbi:hypothetical protein B484DRAFT_23382 [Ochromonadaceae sp. CCMP2298]|nr:hypothetical protein B484DRAFT_23382 [Ochromonadaceae sp. CCMP2298]
MSWHHYGAYKSSSSHGKKTTPPASSNWRYLTEVDAAGPRRLEIMTSTTNAKKDFQLETSDIANIQGYCVSFSLSADLSVCLRPSVCVSNCLLTCPYLSLPVPTCPQHHPTNPH